MLLYKILFSTDTMESPDFLKPVSRIVWSLCRLQRKSSSNIIQFSSFVISLPWSQKEKAREARKQ